MCTKSSFTEKYNALPHVMSKWKTENFFSLNNMQVPFLADLRRAASSPPGALSIPFPSACPNHLTAITTTFSLRHKCLIFPLTLQSVVNCGMPWKQFRNAASRLLVLRYRFVSGAIQSCAICVIPPKKHLFPIAVYDIIAV